MFFITSFFKGSLMFLFTMFFMEGPVKSDKTIETAESGHDNRTYIDDEGKASTLELPRLPARMHDQDHSRL